MPPNYIERPEALAGLRAAVLDAAGRTAIALIALQGMGGIGKTVLAQALFRDEAVKKAFPDGLVWITIGHEPTYKVEDKLREIVYALGGADNPQLSAESHYRVTLADKAALIVIDDVWNKEHLDPFLAASDRSRLLFTTRNAGIARAAGAREHRADLLDAPQAQELLAVAAGFSVDRLPPVAQEIVRECGGLPLALSTMGALLRGAPPIEWTDTAERLINCDLEAIEQQLPPGQKSVFRATDVSVKALPEKIQQQYTSLAVLLDDMTAPVPILQTLWSVDEREGRRIATIAALARVISERDVSKGLRRTLMTQAQRLEQLATQRFKEVGGKVPMVEPGEEV